MRSIIGPMSLVLCAKCGHTAANDVELPTTPVPDLLHGNRVASGSQTRMICDTISAARSSISQLVGEIARLRGVIEGLLHKRDALEIYIQSHMGPLAAARRLPPEILSEIFLQCKDPTSFDDFHSYSFTPRLDKMPLLLGSVCSRWRTIALLTPRSWASFALTIRLEYLDSDVALATAWFGRTGTCPLSIRLACHGDHYHTIQPLMQVFLLYCERWYDICISLPMSVTGFLSSARNRLPRLQRLYIDSIDKLSETIDIFEYAPQLRHFHFGPKIHPSKVKIPWRQLQHCVTEYRGANSCREVLQLTPNLEEFVVWPNYWPSWDRDHTKHSHLYNTLTFAALQFVAIHCIISTSCYCPNFTRCL